MPAVPIVLAVTGTSAAIGAGVATALGLGTVSTLAATAIGTGIVTGTMAAAEGGDAGDVLKAAVVGGATSYVGGSIAGTVAPAVAEATGSEVAGRIAGSVTAAGVLSGGDEDAMLRAGLLSGVGAGISAAKEAAVDEYLRSIDPDPYGGRPGEEFDYLAATGEPADASVYPPQDFGVPVSVDTPFYAATPSPDDFLHDIAVPTDVPQAEAALQSGMSAYSENPDGTRTYKYDDGSEVTIDTNSNVVGYVPSSDILVASPNQVNTKAEEDLNKKLAALNIAQQLTPSAVNALMGSKGSSRSGGLGTAGALGALAAENAADSDFDLMHQVARIGKPKEEGEFESLLAPFLSKVEGEEDLPDNTKTTQTASMQPYFNYGSESPIDQILNTGGDQQIRQDGVFAAAGGAISPLMGTGTRYGKYASGGMAAPLMAAGGKMRVDFRKGDAVTGPGDGQSDDIPAMLADGEFVFPADVVAAIGNGSTKAGSDALYDMMHNIRKHVRSAKPKDLPPEIKSPLDFLKRRS